MNHCEDYQFVSVYTVQRDNDVLSENTFEDQHILYIAGEKVVIEFQLDCNIVQRQLHLVTSIKRGEQGDVKERDPGGGNANVCTITSSAPTWNAVETRSFAFGIPTEHEFTTAFNQPSIKEFQENEPLKVLLKYGFLFSE